MCPKKIGKKHLNLSIWPKPIREARRQGTRQGLQLWLGRTKGHTPNGEIEENEEWRDAAVAMMVETKQRERGS